MITLRKFLEIAPDIICPYMCTVCLEYEHKKYGWDMKLLLERVEDMKNLEPYLDYEIVRFEQEYRWGELDSQVIRLVEVK